MYSNLQLVLDDNIVIQPNQNIIFNNIINSKGGVLYDTLTGVITINQQGSYYINWYIALQSVMQGSGSSFALAINDSVNTQVFYGSSSIKTEQITGSALIEVVTVPTTIELKNVNSNNAFVATTFPAKANLTLFSQFDEQAFGGLFYHTQTLEVDSTPIVVPSGLITNQSQNINYSTPNTLTIIKNGIYEINTALIGYSSQTGVFILSLGINGTLQPNFSQYINANADQTVTFTSSNFVELFVGDELTLLFSAGSLSEFNIGVLGNLGYLLVKKIY